MHSSNEEKSFSEHIIDLEYSLICLKRNPKITSRIFSGNILLEVAYPLIGIMVLLESRIIVRESVACTIDSTK